MLSTQKIQFEICFSLLECKTNKHRNRKISIVLGVSYRRQGYDIDLSLALSYMYIKLRYMLLS